jgi:hypothetical protein
MQTQNDWRVVNWQVQDLRQHWKRQDRRRVRVLVLAVVVLCVLVALTVAPVLSAPPDPDCPPAAVTLQEVEGEGVLSVGQLITIALLALMISTASGGAFLLIMENRRFENRKARQQELDKQIAVWNAKLRELEH